MDFFSLPQNCIVNIPITKSSLKSQDGTTTSEAKLLDSSQVQSIRLYAVIKKANANIPEYVDDVKSFVEVYFISITLEKDSYPKIYKSVARLVQKLIPHHCIIFTKSSDDALCHINLTEKLVNRNNNQLRVIGNELFSNIINRSQTDFIQSLAFENANTIHLRAFFDHYEHVIKSYNLQDLTREFKIRTYERTEELMLVMEEVTQYETTIKTHQKELSLTAQMSDKVRLNTEIYTLKAKIQQLKDTL